MENKLQTILFIGLIISMSFATIANFNVSITPSFANLSNTLTAVAVPFNGGLTYYCKFSAWNISLQANSTNCTYIIPSNFNQSRVTVDMYAYDGVSVSGYVSNFSLIYDATQTTRGAQFVETTVTNYYNVWNDYILGIFALGVAYIVAGTISGTSLTAAVLYFGIWIIGSYANPMFLFFAISLIVIGYITKYAGL